MIQSLLVACGVSFILPLVIYWIRRHATDSNPAELSGLEGRISPGKTSAYFTVVIGALLFGTGMFTIVAQSEFAIGIIISVFGLCVGGFMLPSLFSIHDITWTPDGFSGTCRLFGPTLGWHKTTISWDDVIARGQTITQYDYLEAKDGRRIYWSYLYLGTGVFEDMIAKKCKNLLDHHT